MCVVDAERLVSKASVTKEAETLDVMGYHRFLGYTNDKQTRATAKILGTIVVGTWWASVGCSMAKTHRVALPKTTKERLKNRVGRLFICLGGPKSD